LGSILGISVRLKPYGANKERKELMFRREVRRPEEQIEFLYRLWPRKTLTQKMGYIQPVRESQQKGISSQGCRRTVQAVQSAPRVSSDATL
jgi:hypothetical protein